MSKHKIAEHKMKTFFRAHLLCFAGQKIVRTGRKRKIAICRTVQPSIPNSACYDWIYCQLNIHVLIALSYKFLVHCKVLGRIFTAQCTT